MSARDRVPNRSASTKIKISHIEHLHRNRAIHDDNELSLSSLDYYLSSETDRMEMDSTTVVSVARRRIKWTLWI